MKTFYAFTYRGKRTGRSFDAWADSPREAASKVLELARAANARPRFIGVREAQVETLSSGVRTVLHRPFSGDRSWHVTPKEIGLLPDTPLTSAIAPTNAGDRP